MIPVKQKNQLMVYGNDDGTITIAEIEDCYTADSSVVIQPEDVERIVMALRVAKASAKTKAVGS